MKTRRKPQETAASSRNKKATSPQWEMDMNKFRLRAFVKRLIELGEVEIHEEPVPLSELSRIIEATPKKRGQRGVKYGVEQL